MSRQVLTYELQSSLPHLPVPSLHTTLDKYLRSVEPYVSKEELEQTKKLVQEFQKPGGQGETLQAELLQRANEKENWLAEWWEQGAYLSTRTPIGLFVNVVAGFGTFHDFNRPVSQARRAAETIRYTCEYLEKLKRELVPPEKRNGHVLCMNMFRRLFSSCRIPASPTDHFKCVDPGTIRHTIVLCDGRIFVLRVYDTQNELLTIGDLEVQLLHILRHAAYLKSLRLNEKESPQFVGALTAMARDQWANARQTLVEMDPLNERSLDTIESSLFALCLETSSPKTPSELTLQCAATNAGNRWFDKNLQYLVFTNGMVGANMEHAHADATVMQSMFRWLGARFLNRKGSYDTFIQSRQHALGFLPPPELLRWHVPDEIVLNTIPKALTEFQLHGSLFQIEVMRTELFGKTKLLAVNLFSDAFVQMGIQLAGFRLFNRVVPTYESGHTRMFLHGRTETIQTVTNEVLAWLQIHDRSDAKKADVVEKLKRAMTRHQELSREALSGKGIDRHLFGLSMAAMQKTGSIPPLFTDPTYGKSGGGGKYVLSTSNVSGCPWLWGGFVPMVAHGIGLCYSCERDYIAVMITSFDPSSRDTEFPIDSNLPRVTASKFQVALLQAFHDIYDLVERTYKSTDPLSKL
ncbi:hypothetical protein CCR75_006585 [Bremia lactucae]|uniref:Choline/carnitine acyltransferase domain-containing protein n=1 Tax=Bremia lactucae TaxID=4779 RepID=A0A976FI40_BRELC|nr:hypothetical protein CCR75_006585 [Bremia lactucae]